MDKLKVMLMILGFENQGKTYASDRYKLEHIQLDVYKTYVAYYNKRIINNKTTYAFKRHYFSTDFLFPNDLIGRIKDDLKDYNKEVS